MLKMKVKLLKKLRKRFSIRRLSDGSWQVEGYHYIESKSFKRFIDAKIARREVLLKFARATYYNYSVWYWKRY